MRVASAMVLTKETMFIIKLSLQTAWHERKQI